MKRLSYIIISIILMSLAIDAGAQISVGVGYAHEGITEKISGQTDDAGDSDELDGFYVEAAYDYSLLNKKWGILSLQPGLRFTLVGDSESDREMGYTMKECYTETYFDIPVLVKYSYPLGSLKLSAFAGPVFSVGLSSNYKLSMSGEAFEYSQSINMYTGKSIIKGDSFDATVAPENIETDYGRFDLKLGIGVGASIKDRFILKFGYDIGLLNKYTGEKDDHVVRKIHTGMLYLGVGYTF